MITKTQAHKVIESIRYREWKFEPTSADWASRLADRGEERVYVEVTYEAPNSMSPSEPFQNAFKFSFPLPERESEVARAVYEAIRVIEDHERREFFEVEWDVLEERPKDPDVYGLPGQSKALFHPHGFRRSQLFHALDPYADAVSKELWAYGRPFTADAV